jgi:diaminohydroxyphosphoribosylaminopyrimidine deaminase / 5-amino-6-(5-phosphoribosylamino)uracil reductase
MLVTEADSRAMRLALEQARLGLGHTSPNPAVGCVIVKNGRVVGRGFHCRAGEPHAEVEALRDAGRAARHGDAYVTLEPCCHQGRTGACTDALIEARIRRVVIGCTDPNPLVAGKGLQRLRRAGVHAISGVLENDCADLIRGFREWVVNRRPWVELKLAASLDGRIAAASGASKWLSSSASRRIVQDMRARCDAVLVGVGTVLTDDPRLSCRKAGAKQPLRVVLDRSLRTSPRARVVAGRGRCLIVCAPGAALARERRLEKAGAEIVRIDTGGRGGWGRLLRELAGRDVLEVLVEGGSKIATSVLRGGVANGVTIFYTPILIGSDGIPLVGPLGVSHPARALRLRPVATRRVGQDLVWSGVRE